MAIGEKTNEIPKVKELLDPIALRETVVTADALHTQKDTARFLAEKKGADYLFIVKKNQPSLHEDIKRLHMEAFPPSAINNRKRPRST